MADEGATPRELLLEAARRNNTSLLQDLLATLPSPSAIAHLVNTATDGLGNYALHIAAGYGSADVLDLLLDQEGVEVDPVEARGGDTPLHRAVEGGGGGVVELLLDAGADARIRNKAKLKAVDLVDPRNKELRSVLQKAEFASMAGGDVVDGEEGDGGPTGSASESE